MKPRGIPSQKRRAGEGTLRKGLDPGMPELGPEARNQGAVIPNCQGRKIRKEERCSQDWEKKAAAKVLALKKQKLLSRNIATKESISEERKQCQKGKEVKEGTGSLNRRSKSRVLRMTYPNHGYAKKHVLLLLGYVTLTYQKPECLAILKHMPEKKCIKDSVEFHNIKQRDGESTKEFVRRYKLECRDVKEAPECMKIFRFMHEITNPELINRLQDKISKSMDEMMSVTTTFLRGEVAASNRERKKSFPSWKQQEAGQKQNFNRGNFQKKQRT
nr:reverse transcriptase domain-containing protein [Tanacetum cinerariifolium]